MEKNWTVQKKTPKILVMFRTRLFRWWRWWTSPVTLWWFWFFFMRMFFLMFMFSFRFFFFFFFWFGSSRWWWWCRWRSWTFTFMFFFISISNKQHKRFFPLQSIYFFDFNDRCIVFMPCFLTRSIRNSSNSFSVVIFCSIDCFTKDDNHRFYIYEIFLINKLLFSSA